MQVTINGEVHLIPEGLTVRGLLEHLGMTEGPVAVERNRDVIPRMQHTAVLLDNGDQLEIVHFVGGG
jgi:sulfur carrier protein